jgi:uncharacterized protein
VSLSALSSADLALIVAAAMLIGIAKTGFAGIGSLSVAIFAAVLPARESTGALLPLLIVGDLLALAAYRRSADWPTLISLIGPVAVGVLGGVVFVAVSDDTVMRRTIGIVLLVLVAVHVAMAWWRPEASHQGRVAHWGYGWLGGFTTMVANAGGPVMSLYLLGAKLDKLTFLGTMAWFFAAVNLFKLPFSIGLGLVTASSLLVDLVLVPAVVLGAVVGRLLVRRVDQRTFEQIIIVLTVISALNLVR